MVSPEPDAASPPLSVRRLRARVMLLFVGVAVVLGLALVTRAHRPRPALPRYGHVPSFQLIDERADPFSDQAMLGHVTVVDFIFTRCASSCPRLTARMGELQGRLEREHSGARLVSFSVDPENDTPPVLAEYAAGAHADARRWSFLTGPVEDVKAAVVSGFKVALEKQPRAGSSEYDVIHGDWFVLVDAGGDLRGYYATDDAKEFETLMGDILRLDRAKVVK